MTGQNGAASERSKHGGRGEGFPREEAWCHDQEHFLGQPANVAALYVFIRLPFSGTACTTAVGIFHRLSRSSAGSGET